MAMMRAQSRDRHLHVAQLALRVGAHRLDDVAAERAVLRPARLGQRARRRRSRRSGRRRPRSRRSCRRPRACGRRRSRAPGCRARAAPCRSRTAPRCRGRRPRARPPPPSGISVGVPVGPITMTGSPFSQPRAQARAAAHLEHDERQQALLLVDPRAGERQPLHHQAAAVHGRATAPRSSAGGRTAPARSGARRRARSRPPRRSSASAARPRRPSAATRRRACR